MRRPSRLSRLMPLLALVALMLQPASAFASDGEVINVGDGDSVSNLFLAADGRVAIDIEYTHDCPAGISDCWVEIQFASVCPEIWCFVDHQTWRRVNAVGTAYANCMFDDGRRWEAWIRMGFTATGTKHVTYYGESERVLGVGGSFSYRVIAEAMFNFTDSSGTKTTIIVETATAKTDTTAGVLVATSGGRLIDAC